jgi:16S rRNA (adenine1518-N6/adenine1519-N6)-dimethyltransferase
VHFSLRRKKDYSLPCEIIFHGGQNSFSTTSKTMRNSLKTMNLSDSLREDNLDLRPEQLDSSIYRTYKK